MKTESETSEIDYKFDGTRRSTTWNPWYRNIEAIPSMAPRLDRIGVSKPQKERNSDLPWSRSGSGTSTRDS